MEASEEECFDLRRRKPCIQVAVPLIAVVLLSYNYWFCFFVYILNNWQNMTVKTEQLCTLLSEDPISKELSFPISIRGRSRIYQQWGSGSLGKKKL